MTYRDLENIARRIAGLNVPPGKRIAIRVQRKDDFIAAALGVIRSGAIAVPIDRDEAKEQAALMDDCAPSVVLHDSSLNLDPAAYQAIKFVSVAELQTTPERDPPSLAPESPCLLLYTSGTVGTRKGVVLTQANLAATVRYMTKFMGLNEDLVEYVGSPIDHAFGFGRCRAVLVSGGTLILDEQPFSPMRALALLTGEKCNSIAMAATGMAMLVEYFSKRLRLLGNQIRWVELGSVPMRAELMHRLVDLLPQGRVVMNYGMSEAQRSTMIDFRAEKAKLGTVGRASPGCNVRVRDEEGKSVTGQPGVIEVKGPHVAESYWGRESLWQERMSDGWFETDDYGSMDADGYITFIGRRDDMINIGGDKISPVEIEHRIGSYFRDTTFCVCAASDPDGLYGEVAVVCVEKGDNETDRSAINWKSLRRKISETVPPHLVPRRAVALASLPRTGNGKLQRRQLRQHIDAGTCDEL